MSENRDNQVSSLGIIGLCVTVVYLLAIGFFQWENLVKLSDLKLNEFGDFLAGAFGPLAIFWLILGFFQQSRELRLQVKELSLSVEQQKELVSVTRETLDHERQVIKMREEQRVADLAPRFHFVFSAWMTTGSNSAKYKLKSVNTGNGVTQAILWLAENGRPLLQLNIDAVLRDQENVFDYPPGGDVELVQHDLELHVEYTDAEDRRWEEKYALIAMPQTNFRNFEVQRLNKTQKQQSE